MSNETMFLPEWAVKRNGTDAIILRDEKITDVFGNIILVRTGESVIVHSFTQGAVNPKTGKIYGDEVFCCVYIKQSFNPRPFYIRAKHLVFPEVHSNRQTYHNINALDFFHRAMNDEKEKRLIILPHEVSPSPDW